MKNRIFKDRVLSNLLFIAFMEIVIFNIGKKLMRLVYNSILQSIHTPDGIMGEFISNSVFLSVFLILIGLCLLFMRITKKSSLAVFIEGSAGKRLQAILLGMIVGFAMNAVISLLAGATGTVRFTFNAILWQTPVLILLMFIQVTAEEVLLRGYVLEFMKDRYDWSASAFVSGTLFIFHHIKNMTVYGFQAIFALNLFLQGVLLCLMIWRYGNFWIACGFHLAWNATQEYLFGLPNSGLSSSLALFRGFDAKDGFFYNTVYGNEGSLCTTVLYAVVILFLIWRRTKKDSEKWIDELCPADLR